MDKKALIVTLLTIICWIIYAQAGDDMVHSIKRGEEVYVTNCQTCHQDKGQGMKGLYPPLAKSDFLVKDSERAINILLHGLDGKKYKRDMPPQARLTDRQIADVLNYVRNSWGNSAKQIIAAQVRVAR